MEKPEAQTAEALLSAGALWNTFVMAGAALELKAMADRHLPRESALFDRYRQALGSALEERSLADLYARLQPSDFSRDVLQRSSGLRAVRLSPCGWSDWGTPERVLASLHDTAEHLPLLKRIERSPHAAALASLLGTSTRRSAGLPPATPN